MRLLVNYGARVVLVVDVDADGAIIRWDAEDASTGARAELSNVDKWRALPVMHQAIARMARGAA